MKSIVANRSEVQVIVCGLVSRGDGVRQMTVDDPSDDDEQAESPVR